MRGNELTDYKRNNGKENVKNMIAGGTGAMFSRAVCQPLDVTKVRFQVYPNRYKSMTQAISEMYKEEGLRGLWKGHSIAQTSGLFQGAIQFFLFEQLTYSLRKTPLEAKPNTKNFVSGFLTGTFGVVIISPLEMVKTRIIAQECTRGAPDGAFRIISSLFRNEGLRGVYKGAFTAMLQVGPLFGMRFMIYNFTCNFAMNITECHLKSELPAPILLFAGAGSGVISNAMTYPIDVVKRRMQIRGFQGGVVSSCNRVLACFTKTLTENGPRGLYKGIQPTLIKSAITTSLTFSAFDKIKGVLNGIDDMN